ncbi:MAG: DUF924 family protein [Pseudomonadota bacterium]
MTKHPHDPAEEIRRFWLEDVGPDGWYMQDDAIDIACRERFLDAWQIAMAGGYRDWLTDGARAISLLILLDQFTRNMFRGGEKAFSADGLALRSAKLAIARGLDQAIPEPARQFFLLPFMHAESLAEQERCVRLFMLRAPEDLGDNLRHAILHRAVIRKFGRFPSRNALLGRTDSAAERAYRAQGGYMSG